MTYVKINEQLYFANVVGKMSDKEWGNRESAAITLEMTYEEAMAIFVDGLEWSIIHQNESYVDGNGDTITPDPIEYDNSDFCVAGPVTNNRDDTVTVKMGKYTNEELLLMEVLG
jgi:hypothetical protein